MTLDTVKGHWNLYEVFSCIQKKSFCVILSAAELQFTFCVLQRLLNPWEDQYCFSIKSFFGWVTHKNCGWCFYRKIYSWQGNSFRMPLLHSLYRTPCPWKSLEHFCRYVWCDNVGQILHTTLPTLTPQNWRCRLGLTVIRPYSNYFFFFVMKLKINILF